MPPAPTSTPAAASAPAPAAATTGAAAPPRLPPLPPDPAETPVADEPAIADELARLIGAFIAREYQAGRPPRTAYRDAHAKILGVARARVRVRPDLPAALAHGVFQPGAEYKAWVRFSNGESSPQSDGARDGRGLAVKLCGVATLGPRLPGDTEVATQDFVMIDCPAFFVRDAADYVEFVRLKTAGKSPLPFVFRSWAPWKWRLKELGLMLRVQQAPSTVLARTFHSMTPYRLGPHVVKLRARPLGLAAARKDDGPDSLRAALVAQLAADGARFVLEVQRRAPGQPVEDATCAWSDDDAPFEPVAMIELPAQAIDSDAQRAFGDRLSFSPWHGLMDHRPLGSLNRMRRLAYPTSSATRHGLNQSPPLEPTGDDTV